MVRNDRKVNVLKGKCDSVFSEGDPGGSFSPPDLCTVVSPEASARDYFTGSVKYKKTQISLEEPKRRPTCIEKSLHLK